jgi:hypothetical protein
MKDNNLSYAIGGAANKGTSNKYSGNQYQTTNPNAMINKGRGPTGGGTAMPSCGHEMFTGKAQMRNAVGDGQTTAMPKTGKESFNYGRGPTKGNA